MGGRRSGGKGRAALGAAAVVLVLATAGAAQEARMWRLELADGAAASIEPPVVRAEGGVGFSYGDLRVVAQGAVYDDRERTVRFFGSVRAERPGQVLEGDAARVELETGRVEVDGALARLEAEGLRDPVVVQAARLYGSETSLEARGAVLTTCPLPLDHAHYRITVRRIEVRPGEEVTAYHAILWDSGLPVFYWPYLHFSLKNPRAGRFVPPEVGYGAREGWYVRARVPYMGPGTGYGYVGIDYFQRLGPGLGLYQAVYDDGRSWLALYASTTLKGSGGFPPDVRLGTEGHLEGGGGGISWRAEAGRAPEEGQLRYLGRASLGGSMPAWGLSVASEARGYLPAQEGAAALQGAARGELELDAPLGGPWRLLAGGRWDLHSGAWGETPSDAWDLRAALAARVAGGEVALAASHTTHPDRFADPEQATEWKSVSALPELRARFTLARGPASLPSALEAEADLGRYVEEAPGGGGGAWGPTTLTQAGRARVALRLSAGPVRWAGWRLTGSAEASGAVYSGGARQIALAAAASARWPARGPSYVQGGYELAAPVGEAGSPFRFDRVEYREKLAFAAVAGEGGPIEAFVRSEYDLATSRWGLVTPGVGVRTATAAAKLEGAYDAGEARWEAVLGTLAWRGPAGRVDLAARLRPEARVLDRVAANASWEIPGRLTLNLGAVYQPPERRLERAQVGAAWRALPEWVVSVDASWDLRLGGLVAGGMGIALDQDCRSIAVRYDPVNRRAALVYRIEAFPEAALTLGPPGPGEESQWQKLLQDLEEPLRP